MGGPSRSTNTGRGASDAARPRRLTSVPGLLPERQISLCGDVALGTPDGVRHPVRGTQAQLVLAYLVLEDRPVQRDELADLLWEGPLPDHWAGAVRGLVAKVRAALVDAGLAEDCLVANRGILRLTLPADVAVDVRVAEDAVEKAGVAQSLGAAEHAVALARRAHEIVRSLFLPRNDGAWVRHMRERLAEVARVAAHHEIDALLLLGDSRAAVHRAESAIAQDPLDEGAHHLLLRALIADGQEVAALAAYEHLRRVLAAEFGIRPAAATEALYLDLLDARAPAVTPDPTEASPDPDRSEERGAGGGATAASRSRPALPTGPHAGVFVGRAREIDRVITAGADVIDRGQPGLVVVTGEAGIGKTRLAVEAATRWPPAGPDATSPPPIRLWGRCRIDAGLPYEPIAEALLAHLTSGAAPHRLAPASAGLVTLLPELAPLIATADDVAWSATAPPTDAATARAHLFRSVAAVIRSVAERPALWVIDDLQWASDDTLALLEFVLDDLDSPLLVVVTLRDAPAAVDASLARLQRRIPVTTVALAGLDEHEIAPLVADLAPDASGDPSDVARTIAIRTGGNPFFVTEIAKDAARAGGPDPFATPSAVREWIERRAASLPTETSALLDLTAVIGVDVDFDVLLASNPVDESALLGRLDELLRAGLMSETREGHFAFPHAITRDAVYDRMGATRRARLHRRVAAAYADAELPAGRAAVLAHHFARAGERWRPEAFAHAFAAGRESLDQAAWGLAASQLQQAVDLAADLPDGAAEARAAALTLLGRARHGAGDAERARGALEEAIAIARADALPRELAGAVLHLVGGGGRGVAVGLSDAERAALLTEALDALVAGDPAVAAPQDPIRDEFNDGTSEEISEVDDHPADPDDPDDRALAGAIEGELALALLLTDRVAERERLVHRSLRRARDTAARDGGPDATLAPALIRARIARVGPGDVTARLADVDEVLALPPALRTPEQTLAALVHRHEDLLLLGDRRAAAEALTQATVLADDYAHPYWRWVTATWWGLAAIIDGRLDEAEALAFDATTRQIGDHPEAFACLGVNLIDIRLHQGRSGELLDLVAQAAADNPHIPAYRAVLALCASEAGDHAVAAAAYDHFAANGFSTIPLDTNRLLTFGVLAHTAVTLQRAADAHRLLDLLRPYAGQHVLLNCFGGGGAVWGPVDHQLGRLARLDGDGPEADARLAAALAQAEAFGAPLAADRVRADLDQR